jgi:hypothetical protein
MLEGERRRRRAGRDSELREDVLHVTRDGVLADDELRCDLAIRLPRGDVTKDFQLARAQAVRRRTRQ